MLPQFSYVRPDTLDQALSHLQRGDAAIHAGGTDLLGCLRERIITSSKIVSISGLKDMADIRETTEGGVSIGALATISDIGNNQLITKKYPGLTRSAAEVASPQLRNQGTLGGNLCQKPRCWYYRGEFHCLRKGGYQCFAMGGENQFHAIFGHDQICAITHPSDTAPILIALGATVKVVGPKGKRTIPVEDLHVLPADDVQAETVLNQGEIITHIIVPPPPPGLYTSYRKIRARRAWDFALAGVALALVMNGNQVSRAHIILSGAAPVPWRSTEAEQALTGKTLSSKTIDQTARAAVATAIPLDKNGYKVDMFRGMLTEELHKAANDHEQKAIAPATLT
jgi:xanthine dehydrogenase YagS FAD-binding subunit